MPEKRQSKEKRNRRELILQTSLDIISEEGLRGLTYRAIANRANIPLGSTTYYFPSIEEIYVKGYELFEKRADPHISALRNDATQILLKNTMAGKFSDDDIDSMIENLSNVVVDYIEKMVVTDVKQRRIEIAFLHYALTNESVGELLEQRRSSLILSIEKWFELVGIKDPRSAAEIFYGTLMQLEQAHLIGSNNFLDRQGAKMTIIFLFKNILL